MGLSAFIYVLVLIFDEPPFADADKALGVCSVLEGGVVSGEVHKRSCDDKHTDEYLGQVEVPGGYRCSKRCFFPGQQGPAGVLTVQDYVVKRCPDVAARAVDDPVVGRFLRDGGVVPGVAYRTDADGHPHEPQPFRAWCVAEARRLGSTLDRPFSELAAEAAKAAGARG